MNKIEAFYLIHHSHFDLGYTHDQPIVWEMHRRIIDAAIEACERYADDDGYHACRWTVETVAPFLYWLEHSSDRQIERFLRLESMRRIEVMAGFGHLLPLADTNEVIETLQPIARLRKDYALTIQYAMNCDINGHNWGMCDALISAGVKAFSMSVNMHAGGSILERPQVFRWEAPSGRRLLTLNAWPYDIGLTTKFVQDIDFFRNYGLKNLLDRLQQVNWPFPYVPLQIVHPFWDNGTIDGQIIEAVREWNARHESPPIKLATFGEWWDAILPVPDQLPIYKGDWTDYWSFGCISSAREIAITRESRTRLLTADKLLAALSPLGIRPGGGIFADANSGSTHSAGILLETAPLYRKRAWTDILLMYEHTWGPNVSTAHPEGEDSVSQWNHKAHLAYEARSLSLLLQRDGIAELSMNIPRRADDALILFNPLPWKRSFSGSVSPYLVHWRGAGDDPASSRHHQDRKFPMPRYFVKPTEVPAFGYSVVSRDDVVAEIVAEVVEQPNPAGLIFRSVTETLYRESAIVENDFHRIRFDLSRGGVVSWYDKRLSRELVNTQSLWKFGSLVYERSAETQHPWPRRLIYQPASVDPANDKHGWRPDWRAERWSHTNLKSHKVRTIPNATEVVQIVQVEGLPSPVTLRILIPDNAPWVEFYAEWIMGMNSHPEATYVLMPFDIPNPVARIDVGGQAIVLEQDQLPNSCRDFFAVQHWVDMSTEDWGITIACPVNPMTQLGDFHFGHDQREFHLEQATFLGWVTNNYWEVNSRAYQPGLVYAQYVVLPHLGSFNETDAHQFGTDVATPIIAQSALEAAQESASLPREGTLLVLPDLPILILHMWPDWSTSKHGVVFIRLLNASDSQQIASVRSAILTITKAQQCDLFGNVEQTLDVLDGCIELKLNPRQLAVMRLEASGSIVQS